MPVGQIVAGDCLEIMRGWPDGCIDLVVTSPPYDDLRDYEGYSFDFKGIAQQLYRVVKGGGVIVWVVGDMTINGSETGTSFRQALYFKDIGFNLHDTMIFAKTGFRHPSETRYHQVFEYMFVFSKDAPKTFNPLTDKVNKNAGQKIARRGGTRGKNGKFGPNTAWRNRPNQREADCGKRYNIWEYNTGGGHCATDLMVHQHPAIFPEALAADHIESWSNEGDLILDPLNGSGTTTKMAAKLKRKYIGIDVSPKYCEIARMRLEAVDTGVPVKEQRKGQIALFPPAAG